MYAKRVVDHYPPTLFFRSSLSCTRSAHAVPLFPPSPAHTLTLTHSHTWRDAPNEHCMRFHVFQHCGQSVTDTGTTASYGRVLLVTSLQSNPASFDICIAYLYMLHERQEGMFLVAGQVLWSVGYKDNSFIIAVSHSSIHPCILAYSVFRDHFLYAYAS